MGGWEQTRCWELFWHFVDQRPALDEQGCATQPYGLGLGHIALMGRQQLHGANADKPPHPGCHAAEWLPVCQDEGECCPHKSRAAHSFRCSPSAVPRFCALHDHQRHSPSGGCCTAGLMDCFGRSVYRMVTVGQLVSWSVSW